MKDTSPDLWPAGQQRYADHHWYASLQQYIGAILLVIAAVLIIGGWITWMDRRDTMAAYHALGAAVSQLAAEQRGTTEILTRVEATVSTLSRQNERWVSLDREVSQMRGFVADLQTDLRATASRVQRMEDARELEREMRPRAERLQ